VLLGQLIYIGYYVHQQAGKESAVVDWGKFVLAAPNLLINTGTDTLFAIGGGLVGALYAARKAGKPKMEVRVEG